jgi:predicted nucleic acid-binding protein
VSGFLLDTNIISETIKPQPNTKVLAWLDAANESLLHLSVLTLGEIRRGVDSLPQSTRRAILESWLSSHVTIRFAGRILEVSQEVADRWGRISALASVAGRPLSTIDGLLAATAMHHNLTFVTRNVKDVARSGVPVFNPWEA